jgi:hypothetical protein
MSIREGLEYSREGEVSIVDQNDTILMTKSNYTMVLGIDLRINSNIFLGLK